MALAVNQLSGFGSRVAGAAQEPGYSITKVIIYGTNATSFNSSDTAQDWRLEGSHDGSEFTVLSSTKTAAGAPPTSIVDEITSEITDTDQYNYHRINFNGGVSGAPGSWMLVSEVQFYQGASVELIPYGDGSIIGNMTTTNYSNGIGLAFDGALHTANTASCVKTPHTSGFTNTVGKSWGLS